MQAAANLNISPGIAMLFLILALWDLAWKGIGMWSAARNGRKGWFIAILIINSVGILPMIYLGFFQKNPDHSQIESKQG